MIFDFELCIEIGMHTNRSEYIRSGADRDNLIEYYQFMTFRLMIILIRELLGQNLQLSLLDPMPARNLISPKISFQWFGGAR
jgi:hypothetical protein